MILRRITKHVKDQNWTAVALDFAIVVVGVFMGIQLGNWNDARVERHRENQILSNIATDLRRDIDGYAVSIEGTITKIAAISFILETTTKASSSYLTDNNEINGLSYNDFIAAALPAGAPSLEARGAALDEEFWSLAVLVANAQPATTAFDSLVSAGELGIVQNPSLVQSMQEYRQLTDALVKAQDVTFRPSRDNAIDIGLTYGLSPFRGVEKSNLLALVADNPKLAATVQTQLGWAKGHLTMLGGVSNSAKSLLAQIETELGIQATDAAVGAEQ